MTERLILLPGWGLQPALLQPLAAALAVAVQVEIQPLPQCSAAAADDWLGPLDAGLPDECWLAGWSLGGMLAAQLAARRGRRCRGLITLASNACFVAGEHWPTAMPAATFASFRQGCAADAGASGKRFAMLCAQGAGDERALARQLRPGLLADSREQALAGLDLLAALDNRAALAAFSGRQLHLLAGADALVPVAAAAALRDLLPAGTVRVLEGGGHAVAVEQPERVAAVLLDFISGAADA